MQTQQGSNKDLFNRAKSITVIVWQDHELNVASMPVYLPKGDREIVNEQTDGIAVPLIELTRELGIADEKLAGIFRLKGRAEDPGLGVAEMSDENLRQLEVILGKEITVIKCDHMTQSRSVPHAVPNQVLNVPEHKGVLHFKLLHLFFIVPLFYLC